MSTEGGVLRASLRAVRRHVLGAIDGLGEEDLRRPTLPTGWSPATHAGHLDAARELIDGRTWFVIA